MLVLSRQRDESIMIGDEVEITIVDVRGDKVRLGITAPKHIPVHRREIYDAIQREKAQAAQKEPQKEPMQTAVEVVPPNSEQPEQPKQSEQPEQKTRGVEKPKPTKPEKKQAKTSDE